MVTIKIMEEEMNFDFSGGKEVESNWFKFDKVGKGIKGTLVDRVFQKANEPTFPDQWIYKINVNGIVWNVGISVKKQGTIDRLNKLSVGEIVGIVFESEGESAIKGGQKAKNLKVLSFGMDPNYQIDNDEEVL
ncbi:MAG: hypothetical protein JXA53_11310 [Bacteroidales bacterium]|nr:hypothetical protein [Bacteroidales bacterium]